MKRPVAYFAGTGRGIPSTLFTNFDFAKIGIETTDEWIVERTGIKQRYIAKTESATRPRGHGVPRRDGARGHSPGRNRHHRARHGVPDRLLPSASVDLQAAIGASRAAAFDIGAACSGFIYSATVAESMIATGSADTALVVGCGEAERDHRLVRSVHLRSLRRRRRRRGAQTVKATEGNSLDVPAQRRNPRGSPVPSVGRCRASVQRRGARRPVAVHQDERARGVQARGSIDVGSRHARPRFRKAHRRRTSTC